MKQQLLAAPQLTRHPQTGLRQVLNRLLGIMLIWLGLSASHYANAAGWYEVEMVVFKHDPAKVSSVERFLPRQPMAAPSQYFTLDANPEVDSRFQLQTQPLDRLGGIYNKFKSARDYEVVYAAAWKQPIYSAKYAHPIYIRTGEVQPGIFQFSGTLTLTRERYLHAQLDLSYNEFAPADPQNPDGISPYPPGFRLDLAGAMVNSESLGNGSATVSPTTDLVVSATYRNHAQRRMRSNEVHYIDHPVLGVLLYIQPTQADAAPASSNPGEAVPASETNAPEVEAAPEEVAPTVEVGPVNDAAPEVSPTPSQDVQATPDDDGGD